MHVYQLSSWFEWILKILEAGFIGLNARAGNFLTIKFKYAKPAAGSAVDARRACESDSYLDTFQTYPRDS